MSANLQRQKFLIELAERHIEETKVIRNTKVRELREAEAALDHAYAELAAAASGTLTEDAPK